MFVDLLFMIFHRCIFAPPPQGYKQAQIWKISLICKFLPVFTYVPHKSEGRKEFAHTYLRGASFAPPPMCIFLLFAFLERRKRRQPATLRSVMPLVLVGSRFHHASFIYMVYPSCFYQMVTHNTLRACEVERAI